MYKRRIKVWRLDKNYKADEVLTILHRKSERNALQKPSEFSIRGRKVDFDDIQRYLKRNPALVERFRTGVKPNCEAALEIVCRTPSPDPLACAQAPKSDQLEEVSSVGMRTCLRCEILSIKVSSGHRSLASNSANSNHQCLKEDPCSNCEALRACKEKEVLRFSHCIKTSLGDVNIFKHCETLQNPQFVSQ
jgi:hypothetical protein